VITDVLRYYPERGKKFCDQCGAPTHSKCPECLAEIPGFYEADFTFSGPYDRPSFCSNCGAAYPWTLRAMESLNELIDMADKLNAKQRKQLHSAIDDLVRDTPGTQTAVARIKLLAPKLGEEVWDGMKGILVSIATESVKRALGL
jgi:hypothetical protein